MNRKILITDHAHPILIEGLHSQGYKVEFIPNFDPKDLMSSVKDLYGIVINSKIKMTEEIIKNGLQLKFIARLGSGLEIIDLEYAKKKNIAVINSPGGNANAVAEHALGMLLCLSNNLRRADSEVRNKTWKREANRGWEVDGKTIGIIGVGNTGSALARKLSNWNVELLGYDKYKSEYTKEFSNMRESTIKEIQQEADIVSVHLPLTQETRHLIDDDFIKGCKKPFYLINTSRGPIMNTKALLRGLETRKIAGACLDVFENEKPDKYNSEEELLYSKLFEYDNIILSPHVAGWTHESLEKIGSIILNKILKLDS